MSEHSRLVWRFMLFIATISFAATALGGVCYKTYGLPSVLVADVLAVFCWVGYSALR